MEEFAERLDFERAAMLRDAIREIQRATLHRHDRPLAVSDMNVVLLVATGDQHRTIEMFAMRNGRLRLQHVVGAATRAERLRSLLEPVVTQRAISAPFTQVEVDQLRIITSWLHHNHREAVVVDVVEGDVDGAVRAIAEAMQQLREVDVKRNDDEVPQASEYSQIPTTDFL